METANLTSECHTESPEYTIGEKPAKVDIENTVVCTEKNAIEHPKQTKTKNQRPKDRHRNSLLTSLPQLPTPNPNQIRIIYKKKLSFIMSMKRKVLKQRKRLIIPFSSMISRTTFPYGIPIKVGVVKLPIGRNSPICNTQRTQLLEWVTPLPKFARYPIFKSRQALTHLKVRRTRDAKKQKLLDRIVVLSLSRKIA